MEYVWIILGLGWLLGSYLSETNITGHNLVNFILRDAETENSVKHLLFTDESIYFKSF